MPQSKGHLNPGSPGVEFSRFELGPALAEVVRHVWIVRWRLAAGETRSERVLAYPTFNAVFDERGAALAGADPRLFVKELTGSGYTVGLLLRPAAGRHLTSTPPAELLGRIEPLAGTPARSIAEAMVSAASAEQADAHVRELLVDWLLPLADRINDHGRLVNEACRIAEDDAGMQRTTQLADRLGVSTRTLERVVRAHVGVSPKWLIECRRLQSAARVLFEHPHTDLSALAVELGYADYAHFSRAYKAVLGQTPRATVTTTVTSD